MRREKTTMIGSTLFLENVASCELSCILNSISYKDPLFCQIPITIYNKSSISSDAIFYVRINKKVYIYIYSKKVEI